MILKIHLKKNIKILMKMNMNNGQSIIKIYKILNMINNYKLQKNKYNKI